MSRKKVQKPVYGSLVYDSKINKEFQEPKQNDKNNIKKKLIQAFDHSSAISFGTGLYKRITPVFTLQGNTALYL